MKVALITPIPDLTLFATRSTTHLLLPELCENSDYTGFYKTRSRLGDYVILDNGAHEHDEPVSMRDLMNLGHQVGAREIVLPDVQLDGRKTLKATKDAVDWLATHREEYEPEPDYHPRFMIVPQGRSMQEWNECRWHLLRLIKDKLQQVPVIGIAKHHEHVVTGGIRRLVAECQAWHASNEIHLLGWPRNLHCVAHVAQEFPDVRSIDTARPITFAKQGLDLTKHHTPDPAHSGYPIRDVEYFVEPVIADDRGLAFRNIAWFQDHAMGRVPSVQVTLQK